MKILQFPLIRITICFVIGILFSYYTICKPAFGLGILIISIILSALCYYKEYRKVRTNGFFGFAIYFVFFSIGITATLLHNPSLSKKHYIHSEAFTKNHTIEITVNEKLKSSSNYDRYFADINTIEGRKSEGEILLNIRKEETLKEVITGTQLQLKGKLVRNFKPTNPDQFDYGKYLETKGIYAQLFTETLFIKVNPETQKDFKYYAAVFRNTIVENLAKKGFRKEELGVIKALILGQQQDISPDVLRDYQFAGAVHILSVSGLHVGFIMLFITFLLKPLPNTKAGNTTRIITILAALWAFAFVAGLLPSVVRSATMFSFLAVGQYLNRDTNILHTTIVSLFLILLIKPQFLFDIGFQLSYLALFFIIWLQPIFKNLWHPKNRIVSYFWDILSVSLAAQIGTLPLSIYYFHQFPGLFFITNLVLIPIIGILMSLGSILMILAFFDVIPLFLSKTVEWSIFIMNGFIRWIANLENFIFKEIPFTSPLLVSAYAMLIFWMLWFKKPTYTRTALAAVSLFVFQLTTITAIWTERSKNELIVFNCSKKSIISERLGKNVTVLCNDSITENSFEKKMIHAYTTANFCSVQSIQPLKNYLYFNNKRILIIDKSAVYKTTTSPDIIIIKDSPKLNLDRLLLSVRPEIVIADASNYKSYIAIWEASCRKNKIPFHSIYEKGFYRIRN